MLLTMRATSSGCRPWTTRNLIDSGKVKKLTIAAISGSTPPIQNTIGQPRCGTSQAAISPPALPPAT